MLIIEGGDRCVYGREKTYFKAITDDYIRTADLSARDHCPIQSGNQSCHNSNEMADLEESGYLQQPHTSAGRVPSSKGYRFYVDSLMEVKELSGVEMQNIYENFRTKETDIERLIRDTSKFIARMSHYVCLVLGPSIQRSVFKYLQMIPLDELNVLVTIVVEPGLVENRIIPLMEPISQDKLDMISRFLNHVLKGLTLAKSVGIWWIQLIDS